MNRFSDDFRHETFQSFQEKDKDVLINTKRS